MLEANGCASSPFLKWAGGKRWLPFYYRELLPTSFGRYLEPFLGGGAVYFCLRPKAAVLSDINERLIECYDQVRKRPASLSALMHEHQRNHSKDYYYALREKEFRSSLKKAAQFLYLNRTCWNGLYRVNLCGQFNVPIGTKSRVVFPGESFHAYAKALKGAQIVACDYEETISMATRRDFLFVDPPYTVKHNFNGFAKYNENIFSWADQERLRAALDRAASKGVKILMSNAHHESIIELFGDLGAIHVIGRPSVISGDATFRSRVTEVAITVNYNPANDTIKRNSPGRRG